MRVDAQGLSSAVSGTLEHPSAHVVKPADLASSPKTLNLMVVHHKSAPVATIVREFEPVKHRRARRSTNGAPSHATSTDRPPMLHRKSRFGALETLSETSDENGENEMVTDACSQRPTLGPAGFAANLSTSMSKPSARQMQFRSLLPASIPQLAGADERNGKVSRSVQAGQDSSSDSEKPAPRARRSRPVLKDGKTVLIPPLQHEEPRAQQEKIPDHRLPAAPRTASPNASVQGINSDGNESGAPPQVPALLSAQLMTASPGMGTVTIHNEESDSDNDDQTPPILTQPTTATACNNNTATANAQVVEDVLKLPEVERAALVPDSERVSTHAFSGDAPDKMEVIFVLDSKRFAPVLFPRGARWLSVVQESVNQVSIDSDQDCKRVTRYLSFKQMLPTLLVGPSGDSYRDETAFNEGDLLSTVAPTENKLFVHLNLRPNLHINLKDRRSSYQLDVYSTDLIEDLGMVYNRNVISFYEDQESGTVGPASPIYLNNDLLEPQTPLNSLSPKRGDMWSTYPTSTRKTAQHGENPAARATSELISMPLSALAPALVETVVQARGTVGPQLSKPGDHVLFVHSSRVQLGTLVAGPDDSGEYEIHIANPSSPMKHGAKTVKRTLMFPPVSGNWRDQNGAVWLGNEAINGRATRRSGNRYEIEYTDLELGGVVMEASAKQVQGWKRLRHSNGSASSNSDLSDSSKSLTRQDFIRRSSSGKPAPKTAKRR